MCCQREVNVPMCISVLKGLPPDVSDTKPIEVDLVHLGQRPDVMPQLTILSLTDHPDGSVLLGKSRLCAWSCWCSCHGRKRRTFHGVTLTLLCAGCFCNTSLRRVLCLLAKTCLLVMHLKQQAGSAKIDIPPVHTSGIESVCQRVETLSPHAHESVRCQRVETLFPRDTQKCVLKSSSARVVPGEH